MTIGTDNIEKGFTLILEGLQQEFGLDLKDENLKDTPKRIARAYIEIFSGIKDTSKKIQTILATAFPSERYNSIIFCAGIKTYSMCPHHFLPVEYTTALGYIPSDDGYVLGASKLARIVELLSKRPVLQEKLTKDIITALDTIRPEGTAVVVSGIHYCMRMRGVKQESTFETSSMSGVFMTKSDTRKEFFDLLSLAKRKD